MSTEDKKTYNGGEWTEARYNSFIKSALRAASQKWPPRNQCIKDARIRRGWYRCAGCGEEVPATLPPKPGNKKRIKNIVADHIFPVIDPAVGFVGWGEVIKRMFVELDGFQALCHACHTTKTQQEREIAKERKKRPKGYSSWINMKTRCYNKNSDRYPNWGGRGIKVCERWKDSFKNFIDDMGEPPEGFTIDRIDVDGDYTPDNCRWLSRADQQKNKTSNFLVEYKGEIKCVADWAAQFDIEYMTLYSRLTRGWSVEKSLETPVRKANEKL